MPLKFRDDTTADILRAALHYDPETGVFTWIGHPHPKWNGRRAGTVMACGNRRIGLGARRAYLEHRLVWLYVHGRWPSGEIDHINLDRSDNRLCNLREATRVQNQGNVLARRDSLTGIKGVGFHKHHKKFFARIGDRSLGYFDNPEDAAKAYNAAALAAFGEFARLNPIPSQGDITGDAALAGIAAALCLNARLSEKVEG